MKKVGPTPLFLFSPFHRASLFDEGVSSAKTNRCSVREPRRGRKNSRRATRKRLLKRELCKRESFFFILPTSVFAVSRIPGFLSRKRNRRFSPFPKFFKLPRIRKRASPSFSEKTPTDACFFPLFRTQKVSGLCRDPFFTERYSINAGEASIVLLRPDGTIK